MYICSGKKCIYNYIIIYIYIRCRYRSSLSWHWQILYVRLRFPPHPEKVPVYQWPSMMMTMTIIMTTTMMMTTTMIKMMILLVYFNIAKCLSDRNEPAPHPPFAWSTSVQSRNPHRPGQVEGMISQRVKRGQRHITTSRSPPQSVY